MKRKLIAILAAAAMLLTFAPAVSAADVGNCVDIVGNEHKIAGKGSYDRNNIAGIEAVIDPANTGSDDLCHNPGLALNNGVFHTVTVGAINAGGTIPKLLSLGVVDCDNPLGTGCERNVWHYFVQAVACDTQGDLTVDLGKANNPWNPHTYKIFFNYSNSTWEFSIDGVKKYTLYTTLSLYSCYNMNNGKTMRGIIQSEREDLGDAWSGTNDSTDFTQARVYIGGGNWAWPSSVACYYNNHSFFPHYQGCNSPVNGYSSMQTWTIY